MEVLQICREIIALSELSKCRYIIPSAARTMIAGVYWHWDQEEAGLAKDWAAFLQEEKEAKRELHARETALYFWPSEQRHLEYYFLPFNYKRLRRSLFHY